ncbi:hypothetical protein G9A89_023227 [Geosiphon pyriformis]|nr:hypothetical protein G9A89_023227 [Geosiphon pyriformis]
MKEFISEIWPNLLPEETLVYKPIIETKTFRVDFISEEKPKSTKLFYTEKEEKKNPPTILIQETPPKKTGQTIGAKHLA